MSVEIIMVAVNTSALEHLNPLSVDVFLATNFILMKDHVLVCLLMCDIVHHGNSIPLAIAT